VSKADCRGKLEKNNSEDNPFCQWLVAHKFHDLWFDWSICTPLAEERNAPQDEPS
jgi:hypothetical protein